MFLLKKNPILSLCDQDYDQGKIAGFMCDDDDDITQCRVCYSGFLWTSVLVCPFGVLRSGGRE